MCETGENGPRAKVAFVLATNTYHAYNWWGGANAYCDVTSLTARKLPLAAAMEGAIGILSNQRPFVPLIVAPPEDVPRLVNLRPRDFGEKPWAGDREWGRAHRPSPYDCAAGFLHKWEHKFAAWAESEGIALDYFIDYDLDAEPDVLADYGAMIVVGHSEYWSAPQRAQIERFVDRGGKLAIFSGNTRFWKVRWENDGKTLICHKWRGLEAEPDAGNNGTHLWSHPAFAKPEAAITGLSFLFGGYHRLGFASARGAGGFTVYDNRHWALEGADLFYGDVIGSQIPLLGYENDGCEFQFGADGLPKPVRAPRCAGQSPDHLARALRVRRRHRKRLPAAHSAGEARCLCRHRLWRRERSLAATPLARTRRNGVVHTRQRRSVQRRDHRVGTWAGGRRSIHHANYEKCAAKV